MHEPPLTIQMEEVSVVDHYYYMSDILNLLGRGRDSCDDPNASSVEDFE